MTNLIQDDQPDTGLLMGLPLNLGNLEKTFKVLFDCFSSDSYINQLIIIFPSKSGSVVLVACVFLNFLRQTLSTFTVNEMH